MSPYRARSYPAWARCSPGTALYHRYQFPGRVDETLNEIGCVITDGETVPREPGRAGFGEPLQPGGNLSKFVCAMLRRPSSRPSTPMP